MIGETSGLNTTIQSDRIFRENSGDEVARQEGGGEVSQQSGTTADTVTLSAESVALASNVAPVSETAEVTEPSGTEQGEESEQQLADQRPGTIDIRV